MTQTSLGPRWRTLPVAARVYVAAVIVLGTAAFAAFFPRTLGDPWLFAVLLASTCVTSVWKVNLPISVANGSTLSVSYAANLMSLLLLGPRHAVLIATAGVWMQCTYKVKQPYPLHRSIFSVAAAAITMAATGVVYGWLGGPTAPVELAGVARPLVGAVAIYFFVNTSLVAGAIALSTSRTFTDTWREDFLWSGASFMVAGTAGALAATIVARGEEWKAMLLVAPIYLTYRTYELFVGRLEDQKRHMEEMRRLHQETVAALDHAREAEHALAAEKERLAATLADMTRLEELQHHLLDREQAARVSAEEANRLKDQFLAVVSHELRTPLNAILGWADMLCRGKLEKPGRDRAARTIFDSAKRQAQIIEDLLDVARIMSGKLRLDRTIVDVHDVVRDAVHVLQPAAEAKRISITIHGDATTDPISGDAARLQQILWNLLSNAVKFTPEGGRIDVLCHRVDHDIELIVTDSGEGIPTDFLPSVFESFRQADGSTTRVHPGLGLGLAIVKHLVEAHGGTVTARSAGPGLGAAFTVRLPIVIDGDASGIVPDSPNQLADSIASLDGLSVLVVDDDVESRDVVAAHLTDRHAVVVTASSAAQAFDLLQTRHVDVLLADIGMPEEDGYSLIRRLRASSVPDVAAIPAAALTAFARDEDRQLALRAGFQLHLSKPIDARTVVSAVAHLGRLTLSIPQR